MSSESSFNIHDALYFVKYPSRTAGGPRVEDTCLSGKYGDG